MYTSRKNNIENRENSCSKLETGISQSIFYYLYLSANKDEFPKKEGCNRKKDMKADVVQKLIKIDTFTLNN